MKQEKQDMLRWVTLHFLATSIANAIFILNERETSKPVLKK